MAQSKPKNLRKLVTLTPELAERIEKFQAESGAVSESDALKMLIEDGLKVRDRPFDLFRRCESAIKSGQRIGDIVDRLTSDHPLVETTTVNSEGLSVILKSDPASVENRFLLPKARREWLWQVLRQTDYGNSFEWETIEPQDPDNPPPPPAPPKPRPRSTAAELDDDIPF